MPETKNTLYDEEIEKNVIGSILCYRQALDDVRALLSVESFSGLLHQHIYTAALNLSEKGDQIDIITVTDELKRMDTKGFDNIPYLVTTLSAYATPNYYYSAMVLLELTTRRKVFDAAYILSCKAVDMLYDIGDTVGEHNETMASVFTLNVSSISTVMDALKELYENYIKRNLSGASDITGTPTGFRRFDEKSGGIHPGNLIIVAAETSQGKTSFAMSIAFNAAKHGNKIAVYSMEMVKSEIIARAIACETGISVSRILYSQLSYDELKLFDAKFGELSGLPVYFDDKSTSNIDVIISSIRTMVAKYGIQGVVIDYLQILNVNMKGSNKEQQMAEVARRLKNLAKDLGIWIIALSQLSRDGTNHVPSLVRLRDSGQIAEAADTIILLYRPEVYGSGFNYPDPFKSYSTTGTAMIDVAKGRNIGLMKFIVGFNPNTTKFFELDAVPEIEYRDDNPF
jgi:replicative DNA helicase